MVEKLLNGLSLNELPFPGLTLKELLEEKEMTQKELAARLDMTEQTVSNIINGHDIISNDTALKLEVVFGLSATFWNTLQNNYNELKAIIKMRNSIMEDEIQVVKPKTYNFLVNENFITKEKDKKERVIQLRKFLNLSNLLESKKMLESSGYFRKNNTLDCDYLGLAIWLKLCDIQTRDIVAGKRNIEKIKENLNWIKSLSKKTPIEFLPELIEFFRECGIIIKVLPHFSKVPVHGYIEEKEDKIIICLTIRKSFADIFWFSLFHELGHLFAGDIKKQKFIDIDSNSQEEQVADDFATSTLISPVSMTKLLTKAINHNTILECANTNNIDAGIIVGRLQHDKQIRYNQYTYLRRRYVWAKDEKRE